MRGSSAGPISAAPGMTTARASIGHGKAAPVPGWLDYELWQGPAPRRPYRDNLIHYNWHWFWHWGTGEALNNGTHEVDVCRWALGVDWPIRVSSNGGRYQFEDDWETPDTQVIGWDFADRKTISWEGRSCNEYPVEGLERGAMVYGTEGAVLLDGNNYTIFDKKKKVVKQIKEKAVADPTNTLSAHRHRGWTSCTSRTSWTPSATARGSIPRSRKATRAWRCCTWATSRGACFETIADKGS